MREITIKGRRIMSRAASKEVELRLHFSGNGTVDITTAWMESRVPHKIIAQVDRAELMAAFTSQATEEELEIAMQALQVLKSFKFPS